MNQEYGYQNELEMPSCMFQQSPNLSYMDSCDQSTRSKLYRFHMAKENSAINGCRRKLDFTQACSAAAIYGIKPGQHVTVARRNERERNRVKLINMTFATLRDHLPYEPETSKSKKMSKVDTLKAAINYIKHLQELVDNHDAVNAVLSDACSIDTVHFDLRACATGTPENSRSVNRAESEASFDGLSTEEEELLDFTSWF
ncbi:achaete-scute homolog 1a-like [Dreissena polymorpha]|uniref:BHLH domain-containing protein n=1 Tax=Dreissena polymorpha TaxID=45954 RepID=A0A9D3YX34_DREPO|nr:achaete-scute homolog 1a-like [Dreissena polymorpha]KAH3706916.1 hypothetical protein DPMN_066307 [Dreissena polymorpha]